jgi:hypothetical protein
MPTIWHRARKSQCRWRESPRRRACEEVFQLRGHCNGRHVSYMLQTDFVNGVKLRKIFCLSLVLALVAIALRFGAQGQFEYGYRLMRETGLHQFPLEQSRSGSFLLYISMPVALLSAVCVVVSFRRREPAWRGVTIVLLALYLVILFFAPA